MGKGDITREKILDAATSEFAKFGLSGARVESIAKAIGMSKNHIYIHFGSKEALFTAVLEHNLDRIHSEVPLTAEDLPGYCGALFDFAMANPEIMRLKGWYALEGRGIELGSFIKNWEQKAGELAKAGVPGSFPADFLMKVIPTVASAWTIINPFGPPPTALSATKVAAIRQSVIEMIMMLTGAK